MTSLDPGVSRAYCGTSALTHSDATGSLASLARMETADAVQTTSLGSALLSSSCRGVTLGGVAFRCSAFANPAGGYGCHGAQAFAGISIDIEGETTARRGVCHRLHGHLGNLMRLRNQHSG